MSQHYLLPIVALVGVFAVVHAEVSTAQAPGFINYQPYKLDFSPYQRANDQIFQMQAEMAREEGRRRAEATQNQIQQIKVYYASATTYPSSLIDGWYEVWATDNSSFCDKGKVLVSGNKVMEFYLDDFYAVKVSLPTPISAGKCMAQLGDQGNFYDLYFLDAVSDPSKRASPPLNPGSVSFWGAYRKPTKVFVDEQYAGTFETYFKESPSCDTAGTLVMYLKPGEHQIRAEAGTRQWTNTVTVRSNVCVIVQVTQR